MNAQDRRSLEFHRVACQKLQEDPQLFLILKRNLDRWQTNVASKAYLDQWRDLVGRGMSACIAVATEDSERGQVLRSCSPFAGVLSNEERWSVIKATRPPEHE